MAVAAAVEEKGSDEEIKEKRFVLFLSERERGLYNKIIKWKR